MEWKCPTDVLMDVLLSIAEVEWGKGGIYIRQEDDWKYPPVVVWRYKEKDERRDQLIVDAVKSFNGDTQWSISFRDRERLPGRNWSIMPKRFKEFLGNLENNKEAIEATGKEWPDGAFAILQPEVGLAANKEISQLAEHIKKNVEEALSMSAT